jgi:hypothetical protein
VSPYDLETPFSVEVCEETLKLLADAIHKTVDVASGDIATVALLRLVQVNARRLIVSRVAPDEVRSDV